MFKINEFEINNLEDFKKVIEQDLSIIKKFKYKCILTKTRILTYNIYMYLCMYGTLDMLEYLERYFFFANIKGFKDEDSNDSYIIADVFGQLEIMKYLEKEHNWSPNVKDKAGDDAYLIASINGHLEIMKYLEKEHNWDIHVSNNYGSDAYLLASYNGQLEIMKYLEKEHNWDIKSLKKYCKNDIYYSALKREKLEVIKYLDEIHDWSFHDYEIDIKNKEILKYLTIKKIKKNTKRVKKCSSDECPICLIDFNKDDWTNKCINGHNYHEDCFSELVWKSYLDNKIKCCICKEDMIKDCLFQYE